MGGENILEANADRGGCGQTRRPGQRADWVERGALGVTLSRRRHGRSRFRHSVRRADGEPVSFGLARGRGEGSKVGSGLRLILHLKKVSSPDSLGYIVPGFLSPFFPFPLFLFISAVNIPRLILPFVYAVYALRIGLSVD